MCCCSICLRSCLEVPRKREPANEFASGTGDTLKRVGRKGGVTRLIAFCVTDGQFIGRWGRGCGCERRGTRTRPANEFASDTGDTLKRVGRKGGVTRLIAFCVADGQFIGRRGRGLSILSSECSNMPSLALYRNGIPRTAHDCGQRGSLQGDFVWPCTPGTPFPVKPQKS